MFTLTSIDKNSWLLVVTTTWVNLIPDVAIPSLKLAIDQWLGRPLPYLLPIQDKSKPIAKKFLYNFMPIPPLTLDVKGMIEV